MAMLQVQNLHLSFGARDILDHVSLLLTEKSRAALAGTNGCGKSTLLKVLAEQIQPDSMDLSTTKDLTIAYLPQSNIIFKEGTLWQEVEKGFSRFNSLIKRKDEIGRQLEKAREGDSVTSLLEKIHRIEEALLAGGYYQREVEMEKVLAGLGFTENDYHRPCSEFSGGWQMRIALARTLLRRATIMMLDEPTNYLDIEALTWLKNFLAHYPGGVLLVSHDRGFLDETVNEVFELFNGKLTRYAGNYTKYEQTREMELEQLKAAYKQQQIRIRKNEQFIERFRYTASKSRQVQSRIKQLEKEEEIVIPGHLKKIEFSFPPAPHSGNDVLKVDNLSKSFESIELFDHLSFDVHKKDRLAITGRNGAGKSTLLRMITGEDSDYTGTITTGAGVTIGYFCQEAEHTLNPANTVLEELATVAATDDMPRLRSCLGAFLFSGDDVFKKVEVLSGGERSRLALLKILMHPVNLLILDEPTNHLDINSRKMLMRALKNYDGTMIFVSHDTYFISGLSNRILYIPKDEKPELYEGDWDYFSYKLNEKEKWEQEAETEKPQKAKKPSGGAAEYKRNNRIRNRIISLKRESEKILKQNEEIEKKIKDLEKEMADPAVYSVAEKITGVIEKKDRLAENLSENELKWFNLSEEIEELEAQ